MALYEALKKGQERIAKDLESGQLRSITCKKSRSDAQKSGSADADEAVRSWPPAKRPLAIAGKVEVSIPYPIVGLLVLGFLLVVLVAFKFGQVAGRMGRGAPNYEASMAQVERVIENSAVSASEEPAVRSAEVMDSAVEIPQEKLLSPIGDHVVVVATYNKMDDLIPVRQHFADHGILTVIEERGAYHFLVTKQRYQSPLRNKSDGYFALKKIKKIGATYEAPKGYESFAPNLFQDAYGQKIR